MKHVVRAVGEKAVEPDTTFAAQSPLSDTQPLHLSTGAPLMNTRNLATYLNDDLAGSVAGADLIEVKRLHRGFASVSQVDDLSEQDYQAEWRLESAGIPPRAWHPVRGSRPECCEVFSNGFAICKCCGRPMSDQSTRQMVLRGVLVSFRTRSIAVDSR